MPYRAWRSWGLSRFFRLYEKKRGDRRTGSKAVGSIGEALFFGVFFVIGCVSFAVMVSVFVWPEWRANRQFARTTCILIDKRVIERSATDADPAHYLPEFEIRYQAEGRLWDAKTYDVNRTYSTDHEATEAILDRFEVGKRYECWYDPIDPQRAVLVRGYSGWLYLLMLIPISFIVIGGGGLVYTLLQWNASAERRASFVQRAAQVDLFDAGTGDRAFPAVPADANVTNSPGTTLAYRLPAAASTGLTLVAVAMACLMWNGLVAIFVVMVISGFAGGEPDWLLTLLLIPFVAIGVGLVVYFVRLALMATRVGPTWIEISDHPLSPGNSCEALLSQAGRLKMNSLELWLACDEKATYRQGTDTRTEARRVYEERCFVRKDIEIDHGLLFESRCQIQVPDAAMHSFQANHNEVSWKLIVKGSVEGWPDYQRVFQIVVNPTVNGNSLG
jgi:hypothetical protein